MPTAPPSPAAAVVPGDPNASSVRAQVDAAAASLRPFFAPASVAVVGASRESGTVGHQLVRSLVAAGFTGRLYAVNPRAAAAGESIAGVAAYADVDALPEAPTLAVIVRPAEAVQAAIDACARRAVPAVVVISAGFAEHDAAGAARQAALLATVRGHGMRMVGPNCLGVVSTDPAVRLNATFAPLYPAAGRVAMASESGALGLAVLALAEERGLGLSAFVSLGNRADVSSNDLVAYWGDDPRTRVILLYLESFGNARHFARLARAVGRRKPIVALKSGRTQAGQRASASHTAALAANDVGIDALFHQTGVLRAGTLDELFHLATLLDHQPLPPGPRVGIVTNAGGPGILCADACQAAGLVVPTLSDATRAALAARLPAHAATGNPVDLIATADPATFAHAIGPVLASGDVDSLIVLHIPLGLHPTADVTAAIAGAVAEARAAGIAAPPVIACLLPGPDAAPERPLPSGDTAIPVHRFPETAAAALAKAAAHGAWRARPAGTPPALAGVDAGAARRVCDAALAARGGGWLTAGEVRDVVAAFGLPIAPGGVAATADDAVRLAEAIGYPVALKLASHTIVHKTELDAVRLDLTDAAAVRGAFDAIRDRLARDGRLADMDGALVQPMLRGGVEVMAGAAVDPVFGALVAFGLGGIHVEILGDVTFRVAPLDEADAAEMIRAIRGFRLLQGYRGHPAADIDALAELLLRLSRLVDELPEVAELDLNPVFARGAGLGCVIADARIRLAAPVGAAPVDRR